MATDPEAVQVELGESELLEIAAAMAHRSTAESALLSEFVTAISQDEGLATSPEVLRASFAGRAALYLVRLHDPWKPVSLDDMVTAGNTAEAYQEMVAYAKDVDPDWAVDMDTSAAEAIVRTTVQEASSVSGVSPEMLAGDFARTYEAAKATALIHKVGIAAVYEDDEMYFEACEKANTPQQFAALQAASISAIKGQMAAAVSVRQIESFIPKEILELMSEDDLMEMVGDMQTDPVAIAMYDEAMAPIEEATRQWATYYFLRIYGYPGLDRIDPETRAGMLPKRPWVKELFGDLVARQ